MSRLIDADALMEEIKSLSVTVTGAGSEMKEAMKHCRESAVRIIEEQPTVGEWIPVEERLQEKYSSIILCEECEYRVRVNGMDLHCCRACNGVIGYLKPGDGCSRGKKRKGDAG